MAKQGSKKEYVLTDAEKYIIAENARRLEAERPKGYADILEYANKFRGLSNVDYSTFPRFPQNATISAQDAFAPYYGNQFNSEIAAAKQYADELEKQKISAETWGKTRVQVNPEYYDQLSKQIPIKTAPLAPHYNITNDKIIMPDVILYGDLMTNLSQKVLSKNNYGLKEDYLNYLKTKLPDDWRDTLEHEIAHKLDKEIKFAERPPATLGSSELSAFKDFGYMAGEDHLATGLAKVQREQYSIAGKRFESPEEFKSFIFDLSQLPDTEKAISSFSEEARRALRPQIENAKLVKDYYDKLEFWKNNQSWFRGGEPKVKGNPDMLEKSAQLIPALVTNSASTNYSS